MSLQYIKTKHHKENPVGFLRNLVYNISYEYESILQDLPSIQAIIDFYILWTVYDTEFKSGIIECIDEGDDPIPYNKFVEKYNLPWLVYDGTEWKDR